MNPEGWLAVSLAYKEYERPVDDSLRMTVRQIESAEGLTQASSVMALVRFRSAVWGIVTQLLDPLKASAPPNLPPLTHAAPLSVPTLLLPDASDTVVPVPSSKL